jgi:hypothetical protein
MVGRGINGKLWDLQDPVKRAGMDQLIFSKRKNARAGYHSTRGIMRPRRFSKRVYYCYNFNGSFGWAATVKLVQTSYFGGVKKPGKKPYQRQFLGSKKKNLTYQF